VCDIRGRWKARWSVDGPSLQVMVRRWSEKEAVECVVMIHLWSRCLGLGLEVHTFEICAFGHKDVITDDAPGRNFSKKTYADVKPGS